MLLRSQSCNEMFVTTAQRDQRWMRLRSIGGYGAAMAVAPYLLIKIAWTFGLFLPTEQMGDASWRSINAATAVVAVIGILLAMAFCRPWGECLPAWLIALPVWIGTGLLVPMLLLVPVLGPAAMARDQEAGAAEVWVYEQILVMVSLIGVGVGLPIALAGYTMARWPEALVGSIDLGAQSPGALQRTLAQLASAGCLMLGAVRLYWAAGGTIALDPANLEHRDVWWHMLSASTGAWALAGAWGLLVMVGRRGSRKFLPPMAAAWVSSGMLVSYGLYNNLSATRSDAQPAPEYPVARMLTNDAGIILGMMMFVTVLLVLDDRRRVMRSESVGAQV